MTQEERVEGRRLPAEGSRFPPFRDFFARRADAALETSVACLVLTGHLRPRPEVLRRAEELDVPVLLARQNTMETVEAIKRVFGKTRLGQPEKLARFEALMAQHFDFDRFYRWLKE